MQGQFVTNKYLHDLIVFVNSFLQFSLNCTRWWRGWPGAAAGRGGGGGRPARPRDGGGGEGGRPLSHVQAAGSAAAAPLGRGWSSSGSEGGVPRPPPMTATVATLRR